jgi:hypothetical protein
MPAMEAKEAKAPPPPVEMLGVKVDQPEIQVPRKCEV